MREKKIWNVCLFIAGCILVNCFGNYVASHCSLPLWLDSFGTMLAGYTLGPVCGGIVGIATNLAVGISDNPTFIIYAFNNMLLGIIVGITAQHGFFKEFFKMSCIASLLAIISVIIATPLNYLNRGVVGNAWGQAVHLFLVELGIKDFFALVIGQLYVEFVDKLLMALLLFLTIQLVHKIRKKLSTSNSVFHSFKRKKKLFSSLLVVMISAMLVSGEVTFAISSKDIAKTATDGSTEHAATDSLESYNSYVQTIFGKENGIPCGSANAIASTNDGVLWFGTYAGLYRYSGTKFRMMQEYDSIKNVNCLYVDDEGRLWVGTNDSGLSICINEHVSNVVDKTFGLPSDSVRSIVEASDGRYYVGTSDSLAILDIESGLKVVDTVDMIKSAVQMTADHLGHVAVVTAQGDLYVLKDGLVQRRQISKDAGCFFTCASFAENGELYVGTSTNEIRVFTVNDTYFKLKRELNCGEVTALNMLYFNADDELFVCGDNGVGFFKDEKIFHVLETGSYDNSIDGMLMDYQGNLWFVSSRMGVLRLCNSDFVDLYSQYGIDKTVVNSVAKWQSKLYIGTDEGLTIIDEAAGTIVEDQLTEYLKENRIRQVYAAKNGHLFICTYGHGVLEVTENQQIIDYNQMEELPYDRMRTGTELSTGEFVVGGEGSIAYIKNQKVTKILDEEDELSGVISLCMLEKEKGTVYVGTDGTGILVLKDGKIVSSINKEDGLSSEVILRITKDTIGGGVYVVTSNGLNYINPDGSIRNLEHFPYYNNYDLICVDNEVLVFGSAGIYLMDRKDLLKNKKNSNYTLLDAKYGLDGDLTANSWNYLDENQNLYLPCGSGVYKINLGQYGKHISSFRFHVTTADLDGEKVSLTRGKTLEIERGINKVTIHPEIINYTRWDPVIEYYLEGVDKKPISVSQQELDAVVYTNLPFGKHTFHVAVMDRDGKTVLEESTYSIEKLQELHDTTLFKVYLFVVLLMMIVWFIWFILKTQFQRAINLQKKELELIKHRAEMGNETILAIARTVDLKDENTAQHSQRVSEYSVMIAKKIGFSDEECENLRKAALLHDIGKIGIPDRVLNKPGRLTDEEYAIMKSHVVLGGDMLKDFTLIEHVSEGAKYHHERYDGTGYSSGLAGEEIPLYARIIGIADAFDAMTSNRVYRKQLDLNYVLGELEKGKGTQFDPKLCEIMIQLIKDKEINVEALYQ